MALDDLYQLTHIFTAYGVTMNNAYHAERANPGETAQDVNDAFVNSILPTIRLLQPDTFTNVEVICFSLGDDTDFHTQAIGNAGLRVSAADSPSFLAAAVKFPTRIRGVHSGQKRFAGLMEADVSFGTLIAGTQILVQNIADDLIADWLASADSHVVCNYVIIQRVCDEVDPITGKCLKYRLPEDAEIPVAYTPTTHVLNVNVSSQVSRKQY